jgi:hypothetical protein
LAVPFFVAGAAVVPPSLRLLLPLPGECKVEGLCLSLLAQGITPRR